MAAPITLQTPGSPLIFAGPAATASTALQVQQAARMPARSHSTRAFGLASKAFVAKQVSRLLRRAPPAAAPVAEEIELPQVIQPPRANRLTLSQTGNKLTIGQDDQVSHAEVLLGTVLNKSGEQYHRLQRAGTAEEPSFLLNDSRNRLIHAQASDMAVSLFKSSEPNAQVTVENRPGKAHLAQITGVHQGSDGQSWRIHEKKLYTLNDNEWQELAQAPELKSLHSTGAGNVFGINSQGKAFALSDLTTPLPFTHAVKSVASSSGADLVGLTQSDEKAFFLEHLGERLSHAINPPRPLEIDAHALNQDSDHLPSSIAIKGNTLLLTSASGSLMHCALDPTALEGEVAPEQPHAGTSQAPTPITTANSGGALQLEVRPSIGTALHNALGNHTYEGLFTDELNNLFAKVKDHRGTEHSGSWDEHANEFKPGWNLSQTLVMDRQQGLAAPTPTAQQQIPLARGTIARVGDDLLVEDARTGTWKKSSETDIKHLQAGQDGFAYLVDKDGALKQLNVAPKAAAHDLDKGADLALPGRGVEAKGTVMRGAEIAGGGKIEQVAVQSDQNFMTLSAGVLRLHNQDGERTKLRNPPGDGPIDSISTGGKDFFVLKDQHILRMSGEDADAKKIIANRQWAAVPANPVFQDRQIERIRPSHDGKLTAVAQGEAYVLNDQGAWSPEFAKAPATRVAHEHFAQLDARAPEFSRGRFMTSVNVLGRGNLETMKLKTFAPNSFMKNAVTSHLGSTSFLTKPVDTIQHAWSGREGLKPVYQMETTALQQLHDLAGAAKVASAQNQATLATAQEAQMVLRDASAAGVRGLQRAQGELTAATQVSAQDALGLAAAQAAMNTASLAHDQTPEHAQGLADAQATLQQATVTSNASATRLTTAHTAVTQATRIDAENTIRLTNADIDVQQATIATKPVPIAQRLTHFAAAQAPSEPVNELIELHNWFNQSVIDDTYKTLRSLAEDKGALLKNGDLNPHYKAQKPQKNDLLQELSGTLRHAGVNSDIPSSPAQRLDHLMGELITCGFTIPRRNSPAADSSRKKGDDYELVKARLGLNAKVFNDISESADKLVRNPETADAVAAGLATLHNDQYNDNPIKGFTDAGFRNYTTLEASYDATKSMLTYVRKDNHPVQRNLLDGLQSTPAELTRNLTDALRDLEPRESLKINRNYGGGITGGFSTPEGKAFLGFRGNVDPERTYGMTFTRFDRGLKVSLNKEGATSGAASFGFGGGVSDTKTTPGDSHENIQSNSAWMGGSLDAKYKYSDNTALSFFIREDELDTFMADLMDTPLKRSKTPPAVLATANAEVPRTITATELMNRGVEKEVRTGVKHNFDLELGANVESRTNKGQTDAKPVTGFMRFGVGLLATANLLSLEKEHVVGRGSDGLRTDISDKNRVRVLEKASVTGYARLFSTLFTTRPDNRFVAGGAPMGVAVNLSLDRKTGKTYDVRFKSAQPLIASDLKTLQETLEKAFPEQGKNETTGMDLGARLIALKTKYAAIDIGNGNNLEANDAKFAAQTSLAQLDRQNKAYELKSPLMSTMDMVVKHNDVQRIDKASGFKRLCNKDANPGNAEKINQIMSTDDQLKPLLKALQSSKGTTRAEIKLEVKDSIKKQIEDGALDGTLSDKDLKALLSDRNNLRIKSIGVFRTAAKDESLGVPLPYVSFKSASNLTIERLEGEVTFEYGHNQDNPKKFTLDGKLADVGNDNVAAKEMGSVAGGGFVSR